MSIGKSSIARAVNATAAKPTTKQSDNVITKFSLSSIGLLAVSEETYDLDAIKQSISKRGVLCPVLVAVTTKNDVWLIDGYKRYYAAKALGLTELCATVINAENKADVNRIYAELSKTKTVIKETVVKEIIKEVVKEINTPNVREEKFRIVAVKDRDLPVHLL